MVGRMGMPPPPLPPPYEGPGRCPPIEAIGPPTLPSGIPGRWQGKGKAVFEKDDQL